MLPELVTESIARLWPAATISVERFSSGGWSVEIKLGENYFVIDYSPSTGELGVARLYDYDPPFGAYDFVVHTADEVVASLREIIGKRS